MKGNVKTRKRTYMVLSLILAALLALGSMAYSLGLTLAAPNETSVTLKCESGISGTYTVEVGQTLDMTVGRINQARVGDPGLASVAFTTTGTGNFHVTGTKAGVVTIAYGTTIGAVTADLYQITDSRNISAYTIKDGGEVILSGPGKTKAVPVTVTAGQNNIKWRSSNIAVAAVDENTGLITAISNGMAVIIGEFTDKWGVDRDVHVLVGVGVTLGGSSLDELINLVNQGEEILALEPSPYTPESLKELEDAVNKGKDVLEIENPSEETIKDAIDDLKETLNGLETVPTVPPKPITEVPTVTDDGRILTPEMTGDTANWVEIARNGDYSLIVRTDFINFNANSKGQPGYQSPSYGVNNSYQGSHVQTYINDWFGGRSIGDNLDSDARLRDFTVSNDALLKRGSGCSELGGLADGFSKPSGQIQSNGNDIAFALSFTEAANFISKTYATLTVGGVYDNSSAAAVANFGKLKSYGPVYGVWLRSPGTNSGTAGVIQDSLGQVFQFNISNNALIYPALWVNTAIFNG